MSLRNYRARLVCCIDAPWHRLGLMARWVLSPRLYGVVPYPLSLHVVEGVLHYAPLLALELELHHGGAARVHVVVGVVGVEHILPVAVGIAEEVAMARAVDAEVGA